MREQVADLNGIGETGTGKELIAQVVHRRSLRRSRPFIKLNCAAIPLGLLEGELFGHELGAFTGAVVRRVGRFEAADRGSLFLDEVGDIHMELQAKLLRVLQEGEFERLGSTQTLRADVRLIAATHRDLPALLASGQFRNDLYYRLNVFPISVPPLRERVEDIPALVMHYVRTFAEGMNKDIEDVPEEAMEAMCEYSWPGNIRELRNFIERSVILSPRRTFAPYGPTSQNDQPQAIERKLRAQTVRRGGQSLSHSRRVARFLNSYAKTRDVKLTFVKEMQHAEFPSCLRFSFTRNELEKSRKPSSSACACLCHDWNGNRGNLYES